MAVFTKTKNDINRFTRISSALLVFVAAFAVAVPAQRALASSFILNPSSGSYIVGSIIPVAIFVDTEGVNINAVSGELVYSDDVLRPVSIRISDSLVNLWIRQPSAVEHEGKIIFEGLILNPGFSGRGKIAMINFEVYAPGEATVAFTSGVTLANDGFGSNVLSRLSDATFDTRGNIGDTIARGDSGELPIDPSELVFDSLRPPVVTSYAVRPRSLDEFFVQGVTYPGAVVTIRIADTADTIETLEILADGAGNFSYHHDALITSPLLQANVLSAVREIIKGTKYRFWLTAKVQNAETGPTQMFQVTVGGFSTSEILLGVLIVLGLCIGVLLLYVVHSVHASYRKPRPV
jgi:hypothetical protein